MSGFEGKPEHELEPEAESTSSVDSGSGQSGAADVGIDGGSVFGADGGLDRGRSDARMDSPEEDAVTGALAISTAGMTAADSAGVSPAEMAELFRLHHRRVLLAAYRITGSMADAEDVAQAVFLRLMSAPRSGESALPANVGSYLHRAAANGALDILRRRKTAGKEDLDEYGAGIVLVSADASPEAEVAGRELGGMLRLAISELPTRAAEMFALRYLEDLGNGEIAEMMGTSQAVVAVTLFQARAKLKKRLRELDGLKSGRAT